MTGVWPCHGWRRLACPCDDRVGSAVSSCRECRAALDPLQRARAGGRRRVSSERRATTLRRGPPADPRSTGIRVEALVERARARLRILRVDAEEATWRRCDRAKRESAEPRWCSRRTTSPRRSRRPPAAVLRERDPLSAEHLPAGNRNLLRPGRRARRTQCERRERARQREAFAWPEPGGHAED